MTDRSRSASPRRSIADSKPRKPKSDGFKWKEKKSSALDDGATRNEGRLERGYRDRSPRRDSYRSSRETEIARARDIHDTRSDRSPQRHDRRNDRDRSERESSLRSKPKKEKVAKTSTPSGPMIVVNINDRLGTKAAIPCLPSDSIKAFKAIVAAHIGRQPHEIMIKRQGERPFKDQLTLEDYGVSNGVQLDLEIDTGD